MSYRNRIHFRRLTMPDLPLMYRWLATAHVREWYEKQPRSYDEMVAEYSAYIGGEEPTQSFLIIYEIEPIGYIQSYRISDYPEYNRYVGADETTAGVDLFIGEEAYLHQGLGSHILTRFLYEVIFAEEGITKCIIGPEPTNKAAIRAYEKAGFIYWKTIQVEGEDAPEYLMIIKENLSLAN